MQEKKANRPSKSIRDASTQEADLKLESVRKRENGSQGCIASRNRLSEAIAKLEKALHVLPTVDANGNSDCPFAEGLYALKEDAEEKVRLELHHQRSVCLSVANAEIARCRRNLARIREDGGTVSNRETAGAYCAAETEQKADLQKALNAWEKTKTIIEMAEQALKRSMQKKYPGGAKHKPIRSSLPLTGSSYGGSYSQGTGSAEVRDLIGLGPIGFGATHGPPGMGQ